MPPAPRPRHLLLKTAVLAATVVASVAVLRPAVTDRLAEPPSAVRLPGEGSSAGFERSEPSEAAPARIERQRIARHLGTVGEALQGRDVSGLSPRQRSNRERHLRVLREYRARGEFPRNLDFPGRRIPYFVDDRGVRCAVAYLLHRDGRDDMVEAIAASRNHANVRELADEPGLAEWLDQAGLTLGEAARIQPWYCHFEDGCPDPDPSSSVSGRYAAASLLVGVAEGVSFVLNRSADPSSAHGLLGVAAGTAGAGLGAAKLDEDGWVWGMGAAHLVVGAVSAYLGVRTLIRGGEADRAPVAEAAEGPAADGDRRNPTAEPLYSVGPDGRARLGLRVRH